MSHPLDEVIGKRRPLGIGVTPEEFRSSLLPKPSTDILSNYSSNPRNAAGDWYEEHVGRLLDPMCSRHSLRKLSKTERRLRGSLVYQTDKVVDVVLEKVGEVKEDRKTLGLELKFLGGSGSLVSPKSFVDAVDFTNRPFHCLYMIDGEGWLLGGKTTSVEYLDHWWEFTCSAHLERTLTKYFG